MPCGVTGDLYLHGGVPGVARLVGDGVVVGVGDLSLPGAVGVVGFVVEAARANGLALGFGFDGRAFCFGFNGGVSGCAGGFGFDVDDVDGVVVVVSVVLLSLCCCRCCWFDAAASRCLIRRSAYCSCGGGCRACVDGACVGFGVGFGVGVGFTDGFGFAVVDVAFVGVVVVVDGAVLCFAFATNNGCSDGGAGGGSVGGTGSINHMICCLTHSTNSQKQLFRKIYQSLYFCFFMNIDC